MGQHLVSSLHNQNAPSWDLQIKSTLGAHQKTTAEVTVSNHTSSKKNKHLDHLQFFSCHLKVDIKIHQEEFPSLR